MLNSSINLRLNNQQERIIQQHAINTGEYPDLQAVVIAAISETQPGYELKTRVTKSTDIKPQRRAVEEFDLQPGTGKGIVVRKGQVIRIEQISGGQCADFNLFNLHNRHECLHVGKTRMMHGVSPVTGDLLWSKGPWERPMMAIVSSNSINDTFYPCCSPRYYNTFYGDDNRTNCQQMQEEAQREFKIPRQNSHESFNMFMHVSVFEGGCSDITHNAAKPGDYIDLYALMDVLAVVNICGDDLSPCNNFELKPVRIAISEGLQSDEDDALQWCDDFGILSSKRYEEVAPEEIERDPSYSEKFPFRPQIVKAEVRLNPAEREQFEAIKKSDIYGDDDGAALRDIVISWINRRLSQKERPAKG